MLLLGNTIGCIAMSTGKIYDTVIVGAGVFGAWSAWHLARRGQRVVLLDAYGPSNARASSGGETRIIRMGYGTDEIYTRSSQRSLEQWKSFFAATGKPLFHETGVLWLAGEDDSRVRQTMVTLKRSEVPFEEMDRAALERRYPQISFEHVTRGFLEPKSGVLMARRAVAAVVEDAVKLGVEFRIALIETPKGTWDVLSSVTCGATAKRFRRGQFVSCLRSWLGKVFPGDSWTKEFSQVDRKFSFSACPREMRAVLRRRLCQHGFSRKMSITECLTLKAAD